MMNSYWAKTLNVDEADPKVYNRLSRLYSTHRAQGQQDPSLGTHTLTDTDYQLVTPSTANWRRKCY